MPARARSCVFVEMVPTIDHSALNKFYLAKLLRSGDQLIVGQSVRHAYEEFSPIAFADSADGATPIPRLRDALAARRAVGAHCRSDNAATCLLSYDLLHLPLSARIFRSRSAKLVAFEHNTAPTTAAKRLFHRLGGNQICRLVYTPDIGALYDAANLQNTIVPHPIVVHSPPVGHRSAEVDRVLALKAERGLSKVIFCPSGSVAWSMIEPMANRYRAFLFVIKGEAPPDLDNVVSFSRLEHFADMMHACDAAYVPFDKEGKVSGPFFECVGAGKRVIVKDNSFGRYVKSQFPEHVSFEEEDWTANMKCHGPVDIDSYNNRIVDKLRHVLGRD